MYYKILSETLMILGAAKNTGGRSILGTQRWRMRSLVNLPRKAEAENATLPLDVEELKKLTVAMKYETSMLREEIESFKKLFSEDEDQALENRFSAEAPNPEPKERKKTNGNSKVSNRRRRQKSSIRRNDRKKTNPEDYFFPLL